MICRECGEQIVAAQGDNYRVWPRPEGEAVYMHEHCHQELEFLRLIFRDVLNEMKTEAGVADDLR